MTHGCRVARVCAAIAMAVLTAVYNNASVSPGHDIMGVVDHEAAAASLTRGGSAKEAIRVG